MASSPSKPSKPPFAVPSMTDIANVTPNGYTMASTFSGCGGSCLGFRMAGFRVGWASEFIPAARDTYIANNPTTHVDDRDIREVQPQDILDVLGLGAGELDVLEGSPPCASFSLSGNRDADWGKVKKYSDTRQRTDDLFDEYARLLKGLQPRTFVAENVRGMIIGRAKGFYKYIHSLLSACGYNVEARVIDSQWLGTPQMRQRLIFIGTRTDLPTAPAFPASLPYQYSVTDALGPMKYRFANGGSFVNSTVEDLQDKPSPTITVGPRATNSRHFQVYDDDRTGLPFVDGRLRDPETMAPIDLPVQYRHSRRVGSAQSVMTPIHPRRFTLTELRRICGFPDDFALTGTYEQRWERMGRAVPPLMMARIAATLSADVLGRLG